MLVMANHNRRLESLDTGTFFWTDFAQIVRDGWSRLPATTWVLLGQAQAKCAQIDATEITPEAKRKLQSLYLSMGAQGSVAIEGSSLTVEEVQELAEGRQSGQPAHRDIEQEAENVLEALRLVTQDSESPKMPLTTEFICDMHKLIYRDLPKGEDVVPGETRTRGVKVGNYFAPPAEFCRPLLDEFCEWFESTSDGTSAALASMDAAKFAQTLMRAIFAHLFLLLIHPFGDGNGRLSRVIEVKILTEGNIPAMSSHLFSNHYNQTRSRYYELLHEISFNPECPSEKFVTYALEGFVEGLDEQLTTLQVEHTQMIWESFIQRQFAQKTKPSELRQRDVALALLRQSDSVNARAIPDLSPELAKAYANKSQKTITRDLNTLETMGIIQQSASGSTPAKVTLNRNILRLA